MPRALALPALLALAALALRAAEPGAVSPVPQLDLDRYAGRWYEIARKPNRFQNACAGEVTATYTRRADGRIDVFNQCNEAGGRTRAASAVGRRPDAAGAPAKLEVRFAPAFLSFLPIVWADYWVIDLDPAYRWAAVGGPDRKYFWILSRTPTLDEGVVAEITRRATAMGYDLSDLTRTRQTRFAGVTPASD